MFGHTTQTRHQTNVNKLIKAIFRRHTHHRTGMKIKQSGHTPWGIRKPDGSDGVCVHGMRNMKTEKSNFPSTVVKLNPFRLTWTRKKYMGPHIPINAGSQLHRAKFQRFIGDKSVIQNSKFQIREFRGPGFSLHARLYFLPRSYQALRVSRPRRTSVPFFLPPSHSTFR